MPQARSDCIHATVQGRHSPARQLEIRFCNDGAVLQVLEQWSFQCDCGQGGMSFQVVVDTLSM